VVAPHSPLFERLNPLARFPVGHCRHKESEVTVNPLTLIGSLALDLISRGQAGLLFLRFAFSAPISGAALPHPARSVPMKQTPLLFRPPFIAAAKRVSRATRAELFAHAAGIGRPSAEHLGLAGVCRGNSFGYCFDDTMDLFQLFVRVLFLPG
jgi:hypothetical protein